MALGRELALTTIAYQLVLLEAALSRAVPPCRHASAPHACQCQWLYTCIHNILSGDVSSRLTKCVCASRDIRCSRMLQEYVYVHVHVVVRACTYHMCI